MALAAALVLGLVGFILALFLATVLLGSTVATQSAAAQGCPGALGAGPGAGAGGGGGDVVGASTYGGPGDPTSGDHGAYGPLPGHFAFAELSNNYGAPINDLDFSALGHLPPHTLLQVTYNGRSLIAEKLDIGGGGPPVGDPPAARRIDLWYETAAALGFEGVGLVAIAPAPAGTDPSAALVPGGGAAPNGAGSGRTTCLLPAGGGDGSALLANPRVQFTRDSQKDDLAQGRIDRRIIAALDAVAQKHTIVITSLRTDHSPCAGGSSAETADGCAHGLSNHGFGRAADIGVVDGEDVSASSGAAHVLVDELIASNGQLGLTELGQPFYDRSQGDLYMFTSGHGDHIHIGIDGNPPQ